MSITLLKGDCRHVLREVAAESVQCVVTSPPYYGLRSYGIGAENGEIGLERTPDEYIANLVAVFREVRRVLRNDGIAWLNLGDSYAANGKSGLHKYSTLSTLGPKVDGLPGNQNWKVGHDKHRTVPEGYKPKDLLMIPARVVLALQADGWYLRSHIIWHKPNPMPESCRDRPASAHESVFLLTKRPTYFYDADAIREPQSEASLARYAYGVNKVGKGVGPGGASHTKGTGANRGLIEPNANGRNARNVWTITSGEGYRGAHFATMPPELAERCIKAGTSERGCCPACGVPWERMLGDPVATDGRGAGNGFKRAERISYTDSDGSRGDETIWVPKSRATIGWRPTCSCQEHTPLPCTVLDPFSGAGTTALVADRLGRNAIGIDLNPDYTAMSASRIREDAPLFADIVGA